MPAFGSKRVDQISMQMINAWKMGLWNRDGRSRKGLSRVTLNQILQTLRGIFDHAVEAEYLRRTPAGRQQVPGIRKQRKPGRHAEAIEKAAALTEEQAAATILKSTPGLFQTFIMTALCTGARSGELLGARWRSLDLDAGMLHIEGSLSRIPGEKGPNGRAKYGSATPHNGPPKSDSSRRSLELPAELVRVLKAWKGEPASAVQAAGCVRVLEQHREAAAPRLSDEGAACRVRTCGGSQDQPARVPTQLRIDPDRAGEARHAGGGTARAQGRRIKRYAHWFKGTSSRSTMEELAGAMLSPTKVVGR